MKILFIEDEINKRDEIIGILCDAEIVKKNDFTICDNIISAKKILKEKTFDVMLLDINLPIREDSKCVTQKAGLDFFKEIKNHRLYHQPKEIIAITAYEEEYNDVKDELAKSMIHIIYYHSVKEEWEKLLIDRLEYLISADLKNQNYNYDLAIICALNDPELSAVKELTNNWKKVELENTTIPFYESTFNFDDKVLKVVIVSTDKMGMVPTAVLSTQTIELFKPRYLAMTGIAAGVKDGDNINLGDILIPNHSWDSGSGKIKKDNEGNILFEIDPKQENPDGDILNNCLELSNDEEFANAVRKGWKDKKIKSIPSIHIGPMASGAAVIANGDITKEIIRQQQRNIIGIEMEAYGLIYAANHAIRPKPEVIIMKSVCDFADEHKNDGYQSYAAYTSASFLYEYARRYIT